MPFGIDPLLVVVLVFVLLVIFVAYLFVRRTTTAYREGRRERR